MPIETTRRGFLQTGMLVGGLLLVGCTREELEDLRPRPEPDVDGRRFFTPEEARTVEAIIARLIPGDESDPGAREAGVLTYIDRKLAEFPGFAAPAYLDPPFVVIVPAGQPTPPGVSLAVPEDQLYRYGYQSGTLPHQVYRSGLPQLDDFARSRGGAAFADLGAEQQDDILSALGGAYRASSSPEGTGASGTGVGSESSSDVEGAFTDPNGGALFGTVWQDTMEGFFADPVHGGNQNLAGWRLIGYPGPQRAYSPEEMLRGTRKRMQSLDDMPAMNPDRRHDHGDDALVQPHPGVVDG